jgi:hypothetical protein
VSGCTSPWFGGPTVDHLFDDCPSYLRGRTSMEACGWGDLGGPDIDPHGGEVCGLCRHRHDRKCHRATEPATEGVS